MKQKNITSDMKTKTYYVGNLISEVISVFMTYYYELSTPSARALTTTDYCTTVYRWECDDVRCMPLPAAC